MEVCTPPSQFAAWVNIHSICSADDAKHLPFWQHFPAPNTGTLGNMFHTSYRFLGHVQSTFPPPIGRREPLISTIHYPRRHLRACVSCA